MPGSQNDDAGVDVAIEPLTRRNAKGEVYQRTAAVERQIRDALRLRPDGLRQRAAIDDKNSGDYLQEESLVYLIRHYHRAGGHQLVNDLAERLLRRSVRVIEGHLRSLGPDATEEGFQEVVGRLFEQILDLQRDRGDFLQVRFWPAVEKLAVRAFQRQLSLHQRAQRTVPMSSLAGYDRDEDSDDERAVRFRGDAPISSTSAEDKVLQNDQLRDALSRLAEPFRSAYLMRHYLQWPVEDQDPNVRTISGHFGKDPRTIRNWLKKAEEILENWRGEQ